GGGRKCFAGGFEGRGDAVRRISSQAPADVGVEVCGDRDLGVPQPLGCHLHLHTSRQTRDWHCCVEGHVAGLQVILHPDTRPGSAGWRTPGVAGRPSSRVKTRPGSFHAGPQVLRSRSWVSFCLCSMAKLPRSTGMTRVPRLVFGVPTTPRPWTSLICCTTDKALPSKSTPSQREPIASPRRIPVTRSS